MRARSSRVVAAIAGANAAKRQSELKPFVPLFHELCNKLSGILQVYTSGAVRCSVSSMGVEIVKPDEWPAHGAAFKFDKGEFGVRFRTERAFESVLCEMCFGGTGTGPPEAEDSARPPSRVEVLLKNMVLDSLHDALPEVFRDLANVNLVAQQGDSVKAARADERPVPHVRASILLNVFSMSAEMEALLPLVEVEAVFGTIAVKEQASPRNMSDVLGVCPFELMVALPAEEVGLHDVMALSVGSLLKLESRPSDLSLLSVSGVVVGKGRLNVASDCLGVQVT